MLSTLALTLAMVPQGPIGSSTAPVVINEITYDDSGTDDREFIELYNRSGAPVDISNWVVDGEDPSGPNQTVTIPGGTILAAGGFYVLADTVAGLVPNTNLHIPSGFFENSNEVVYLKDAGGIIIDSFAYEISSGPIPGATIEGEGLWHGHTNRDAQNLSQGRAADGADTDLNGNDFKLALQTPGTTNNVASLPFTDGWDAMTPDTPDPAFDYSYVAMTAVDPTTLGALNGAVKPVSPQGGNAAMLYDPAGGGNTATFGSTGVKDIVVECYAYFYPKIPSAPAPAPWVFPDAEYWGFGVRGMTGLFAHPRDVPGQIEATTRSYLPEHSGISWYYYAYHDTNQVSHAELYLLDFNDGGSHLDFKVLAGPIAIQAGVNDGWQRLRLHVAGNMVHANFGGTYGQDDGMRVTAETTTVAWNTVWFNYREYILDLNGPSKRAFTIDALNIRTSGSDYTRYGTGSPTTAGTPEISADGLPLLGSTWTVKGTNMVPNGPFSGVVYGFQELNVPIGGAPAGANLLVLPFGNAIGFPNAQGEVSFVFPVPPTPALAGIPLYLQLADFDFNITGATLRIGVSGGLKTGLDL